MTRYNIPCCPTYTPCFYPADISTSEQHPHPSPPGTRTRWLAALQPAAASDATAFIARPARCGHPPPFRLRDPARDAAESPSPPSFQPSSSRSIRERLSCRCGPVAVQLARSTRRGPACSDGGRSTDWDGACLAWMGGPGDGDAAERLATCEWQRQHRHAHGLLNGGGRCQVFGGECVGHERSSSPSP